MIYPVDNAIQRLNNRGQIISWVCWPFLDTSNMYLPTLSGYVEKLNLIIIKERIF